MCYFSNHISYKENRINRSKNFKDLRSVSGKKALLLENGSVWLISFYTVEQKRADITERKVPGARVCAAE